MSSQVSRGWWSYEGSDERAPDSGTQSNQHARMYTTGWLLKTISSAVHCQHSPVCPSGWQGLLL
jgi:hypothetical protein